MAALPADVLPDPRGLWTATLVGTVFSHDPFMPLVVFSLVHYISVYPTHAASVAPAVMQREFIVRMLLLAVYGTLAGLALLWAMGSPVLFPTHTRDTVTGRLRLGAYAIALTISASIYTGLQVSDRYWNNIPYVGSLPKSTVRVFAGVGLAIAAVVFVAVQVLTILGRPSALTLAYYGRKERPGRRAAFIVFSIWVSILVLLPQAIWDFAGAPSGTGGLTSPQAAGVTFVVEIAVWLIVIVLGQRLLAPDRHVFARMPVTWRQFGLIMLVVQVATGALYLLLMLAATTFDHLDWIMLALTAGVALASFFFYRQRGRFRI